MDNWPGWTTRFELMYRQEQSRHASGRTRVKDFGTPIWRAAYQSRLLRPNEVDEWRARLAALENGMTTFSAWPMSRCWPIAHPNGVGAVPGVIGTIGAENDTIAITWTGGTTTLRVGDYVELNSQWLHQVTGVLTGGVVQIVPHLSVGALVGQSVNIERPAVLMTLIPGSVSSQTGLNGRASISFEAIEARG